MEYEVKPEPTPEELEALILALEGEPDAASSVYRSAWREAALVGNEEE